MMAVEHMGIEQFRALTGQTSPTSHTKARKIVVDGEKFDSKGEYIRWTQLKAMESVGEIEYLRHQAIVFRLGRDDQVGRDGLGRIVKWTPDYTYWQANISASGLVAEDFKGRRFRDFGVRIALFHEKFPEWEVKVTTRKDL